MLTPHFGIFNPSPRQQGAANANRPPQDLTPEALSTADDDLSLYSRLERDALLLSFGDATDCEADTREAPLRGGERPWRFIGMLLPPYS